MVHVTARRGSPHDCGADDLVRAAGFVDRKVARVDHAERLEDVVLGVDIERLAGECLDDVAEEDEVDIGVTKDRGWRGLQRGRERAIDALGFVGFSEAPRVFEVDVGGFAREVREQHAHGDLRALGVVVLVERWEELLDGFVEGELALLVELHDAG